MLFRALLKWDYFPSYVFPLTLPWTYFSWVGSPHPSIKTTFLRINNDFPLSKSRGWPPSVLSVFSSLKVFALLAEPLPLLCLPHPLEFLHHLPWGMQLPADHRSLLILYPWLFTSLVAFVVTRTLKFWNSISRQAARTWTLSGWIISCFALETVQLENSLVLTRAGSTLPAGWAHKQLEATLLKASF